MPSIAAASPRWLLLRGALSLAGAKSCSRQLFASQGARVGLARRTALSLVSLHSAASSLAKRRALSPPSMESSGTSGTASAEPIQGNSEAAAVTSPLPPKKPLRAILFDVDGTLADSDPLHFLAFREILLELGFNNGEPIDEAFFRARISGRHNPDITQDLFPSWDEKQRDDFTLEKEARFRRMALSRTEEVPGLKHFCTWVAAQGILRAAVTNAPRENAEQMIRGLGLSDFFQHLVIGSECTRAKPFPDPYITAMELLGVSADECFAVEDSPAGIQAAIAASVPTVGVLTGQTGSTLIKAGAIITVQNYSDPIFWQYVKSRALRN